jgi:uncharacterized membrane protein YgcG
VSTTSSQIPGGIRVQRGSFMRDATGTVSLEECIGRGLALEFAAEGRKWMLAVLRTVMEEHEHDAVQYVKQSSDHTEAKPSYKLVKWPELVITTWFRSLALFQATRPRPYHPPHLFAQLATVWALPISFTIHANDITSLLVQAGALSRAVAARIGSPYLANLAALETHILHLYDQAQTKNVLCSANTARQKRYDQLIKEGYVPRKKDKGRGAGRGGGGGGRGGRGNGQQGAGAGAGAGAASGGAGQGAPAASTAPHHSGTLLPTDSKPRAPPPDGVLLPGDGRGRIMFTKCMSPGCASKPKDFGGMSSGPFCMAHKTLRWCFATHRIIP